jgi:hypothetical protein
MALVIHPPAPYLGSVCEYVEVLISPVVYEQGVPSAVEFS